MKLTYTIYFVLLSLLVNAQDSAILDVNNTNVLIRNTATNFLDLSIGYRPHYQVPKQEGLEPPKGTIFASSLWVSALDELDTVRVAATIFDVNGSDFQSGILNELGETKYDRMYVVSRSEIEEHIADPSSPIEVIRNWPGNGDTTQGEPWQLAPFVDVNENGIYEPFMGDYPMIKGDKAAYCIYNDQGKHVRSGSKPLGIEVHEMYYQHESNGTVLDETNLAYYRIINRSNRNYHDLRIGLYVNFEIGYFGDDFAGCDTVQNMFYAVNADDFDETEFGYGENPPSQSVVFLNHSLSTAIRYNNNTNPISGNPTTALGFYNYMRGLLMNGDSITYYLVDKSVTSTFMNSGDPNVDSSWYKSPTQRPGGQRMLGCVGPYSLAAGESICVDLAFVYGRSKFKGALGSYDIMKYNSSQVQYAYHQNLFGWKDMKCVAGNGLLGEQSTIDDPSFSLYPNPTSSTIHNKSKEKNIQWTVISIHGEELDQFTGESYDASHLSPGMYVLRSELGAVRFVRR